MELLIYLLKVSACTVLFFAFYLLVLRKLTFFKINRFYLLLTLLLSFVIPTLNFTIEREVEATPIVYAHSEVVNGAIVNEPITSISSIQTTPIIEESFDYYALLPYLYFGIVFSLLVIATWRILQLLKHTKNGAERINGLKIVKKSAGFTNCSFFNYVFIDEKLSEAELQVLLKHEEVHAKQLHSIDKIMMMLIKAFLWFNPVVYFYDKALEQAHEYEADEATSQNFGTEKYASLLLRLAIAKSEMPLVHNFVKSPIKDRIKMLFNSKSKNMKKLIYLLAIPIGLVLLWSFTVKVVEVAKPILNDERPFTLVLDAGHGGNDAGAKVEGYTEKEIVLGIAIKIKALAEAKGIKVVTTRANDKNVSLKDRAKEKGDVLISLHINSEPLANGGKRNGIEMFVPTSDKKLIWIKSNMMMFNLYQNLKTINGIKTANKPIEKNLFLLQNSNLPGIVLELGYLTNQADLKIVTNTNKQTELAEAIVDGIINYKNNLKTDKEILDRNLNALPPPPNKQTDPIIQRKIVNEGSGINIETTTIFIDGKKINTITSTEIGATKIFFYVNGKTYNENEISKFTLDFTSKLSDKNGAGNTKNQYKIDGLESSINNYVIWFGMEPPLGEETAKSRSYAQKYNGKTVEGEIIELTYSPTTKLMDGFIIKATNGDMVKANVEAKFAELTKGMIKKGDKINVKVYNANYWPSSTYPVLTSYKLMKDGKLLYDRWPKVAVNQLAPIVTSDGVRAEVKTNYADSLPKPKLLSSRKLTVDTKADVNYITGGRMQIGKDIIEAEYMIWDRKSDILTAETATIKYGNREVISGNNLEYNFKSGTSRMLKTFEYVPKDDLPSKAYQLISKLKFNKDSIKKMDMLGNMVLKGRVKLNIDNYILDSKVVEVKRGSDIIKSYLGSIKNPDGVLTKADVIEFDVITKKFTTDKKLP